jgi:hypothetical protein
MLDITRGYSYLTPLRVPKNEVYDLTIAMVPAEGSSGKCIVHDMYIIWINMVINKYGWWFGTMEFYDFPFSWECHHPN